VNRSMSNRCGVWDVLLAAMVLVCGGCSRPDSPTTGPKQERPSAVNSKLGTEQIEVVGEPLVVSTPEQVEDESLSAAPPLAVAPFDAAAAQGHQEAWAKHLGVEVETVNSIGIKLVLVPPGEFQMGSPESEPSRDDDETQHRVRITKPYYLGMYEVTQAEYERVMGANPSNDKTVAGQNTSRFPVERVSWEEAVEFCRKLSAMSAEQSAGRVYRLPTEAEWEFACRAGTVTPFHFGSQLNGREANCDGNYPYGTTTKGTYLQRPTTVGSYASNGFGLFDMHGNVREWCSDWYDSGYYANSPTDDPTGLTSGSLRVDRGGGWDGDARDCRSAYRYSSSPDSRYDNLGFRLASSSVDQSGQ
jgi:formylglycine-generating enzyme required for sulfatase activity